MGLMEGSVLTAIVLVAAIAVGLYVTRDGDRRHKGE